MQNANDLKTSANCSNNGIHCEVVYCIATLSSRLSEINVVGSKVSPSAKLKTLNETLEGGVGKGGRSGAGSSNIEGFVS